MQHALIHHLDVNRPLIIGRALLSAAAGLVPVPYLDEALAGMVRRAMIRRLAEIRGVDLDSNAIDALSTPRGSRLLSAATIGSVALGSTRAVFRRVAASLLMVRRVDDAMQTFQTGTLFDHYCAAHHVGLGLDGARATELRKSMDAAVSGTHGEALRRAFARTLRTPGAIVTALPKIMSRAWKSRKGAPINPEKLDEKKLDEKLRSVEESSSWLRRAVSAVGGVGTGYGRSLASSFDESWRA